MEDAKTTRKEAEEKYFCDRENNLKEIKNEENNLYE